LLTRIVTIHDFDPRGGNTHYVPSGRDLNDVPESSKDRPGLDPHSGAGRASAVANSVPLDVKVAVEIQSSLHGLARSIAARSAVEKSVYRDESMIGRLPDGIGSTWSRQEDAVLARIVKIEPLTSERDRYEATLRLLRRCVGGDLLASADQLDLCDEGFVVSGIVDIRRADMTHETLALEEILDLDNRISVVRLVLITLIGACCWVVIGLLIAWVF
jgi:hypothetical protein